MIRKSGKSFSTISAEPSIELLSTISASIRSPFASRCTNSRHWRKSSLVLNETTTTEASYGLFSTGSKGGHPNFDQEDLQIWPSRFPSRLASTVYCMAWHKHRIAKRKEPGRNWRRSSYEYS